ncbi:hypothetical protein GT347_00090 [Xylophilus rhododendri]|uniref:Uncharacterized protein n=1 Tax=Xylophilus rhododendri TaxID=2697032 RepID=A0A857IYL1_9BURK|nr:hypothetical protein [Xylophilus rhododendri]QHI96536.1 hypothetical protein GT347_00090 [Xylophilus rhododendri]
MEQVHVPAIEDVESHIDELKGALAAQAVIIEALTKTLLQHLPQLLPVLREQLEHASDARLVDLQIEDLALEKSFESQIHVFSAGLGDLH